jgi:hypothetical protein
MDFLKNPRHISLASDRTVRIMGRLSSDIMKIIRSQKPLSWGQLDLPLWGLSRDLSGSPLRSPMMFSLAEDEHRLWFLASSNTPATLHPQARPGQWIAELWKYDCAEFFIADPHSGRYLEFNLAANGAWWSAEFVSPRQQATDSDIAFPEVATFAELAPTGGWLSAMAIPLDLLRARIGWSADSRVNVTFITQSPDQKFVSALSLPGTLLDFHQPQHFSQVDWIDENALPT